MLDFFFDLGGAQSTVSSTAVISGNVASVLASAVHAIYFKNGDYASASCALTVGDAYAVDDAEDVLHSVTSWRGASCSVDVRWPTARGAPAGGLSIARVRRSRHSGLERDGGEPTAVSRRQVDLRMWW